MEKINKHTAEVRIVPDSIVMSHNSKLITGIVYIHVDDFDFPVNKWDDFIVIILGWWINDVIDIKNKFKNKALCRFMDGSWAFILEMLGNNCKMKLVDTNKNNCIHEVEIYIDKFILSLINCADIVLDICDQHGWKQKDIHTLRKSIESLRNCV